VRPSKTPNARRDTRFSLRLRRNARERNPERERERGQVEGDERGAERSLRAGRNEDDDPREKAACIQIINWSVRGDPLVCGVAFACVSAEEAGRGASERIFQLVPRLCYDTLSLSLSLLAAIIKPGIPRAIKIRHANLPAYFSIMLYIAPAARQPHSPGAR